MTLCDLGTFRTKLFNYFQIIVKCLMSSECERFYQEITVTEERYLNQWKAGMIADYCWCLNRKDLSEHARKSGKRAFFII